MQSTGGGRLNSPVSYPRVSHCQLKLTTWYRKNKPVSRITVVNDMSKG